MYSEVLTNAKEVQQCLKIKKACTQAILRILLFLSNVIIFLNSVITVSNYLPTFTRTLFKNYIPQNPLQEVGGIAWVLKNNQTK